MIDYINGHNFKNVKELYKQLGKEKKYELQNLILNNKKKWSEAIDLNYEEEAEVPPLTESIIKTRQQKKK